MSKKYQKTLKKYRKWINRLNNKIQNAYHKFSKYLVKNYDLIGMENLNIKGMFKNKKWSNKMQKISLYKLITMIQYKADWYGKTLIQIDIYFPSSKKCHVCGHINHKLTIEILEWICPHCGTELHRDINAAINILNEAKRIQSTQ